ncbi:MAG TPA: hypothetical protein ENJ82_13535 [Bacteroidetes bacterium]|nr:hypothetical protein [Bacteroidota bacterium]
MFTFQYYIRFFCFIIPGFFVLQNVLAQPVPGIEENISFLVTFGINAPADWGDDDHCSVFFFSLPAKHIKPFYIRIFDPNVSGKHDEQKGTFDTRTRFAVYGGTGAFSNESSQGTNPEKGFDTGVLLMEKTFDNSDKYDDKWYTLGPFNPKEGERLTRAESDLNYFKIIVQGISGDDGNLYKMYYSDYPDKNQTVEGGASFTFEYTFRMKPGMAHLYPFIDNTVLRIRQQNFDFDDDGYVRLVSVSRKSEMAQISRDGEWGRSDHLIYEAERNFCMDIQVVSLVQRRNNNVVFSIHNQYGEALPFLNIPIGIERIENYIRIRKNR